MSMTKDGQSTNTKRQVTDYPWYPKVPNSKPVTCPINGRTS